MELRAKQRRWAGDPKTPSKELLLLAQTCPEEVLANPVLPLLLLEDPSFGSVGNILNRFARLRALAQPLERKLADTTARIQRLFACDCAERALARFGGESERFLQEALGGARALAEGTLSKEKLDDFDEGLFCYCLGSLDPHYHAIYALFEEDARTAAQQASLWTATGVYGYEITLQVLIEEVPGKFLPEEGEQARERAWQMGRLEYYLKGE